MVIRVKCRSCGKQLKVKDSAAGKTGKCPQCAKPIKIPEAIYDAEEVTDDSEAEDYEDYGSDDTYGFEGLDSSELNDYGSPSVSDRRPCPMCGEMIVNTAAKCRYCGEIFDETLKRRSEKKKKKKNRRSYDSYDEDMTIGDWVGCALCGGIACIFGLVYMIQGKPKGIKMVGASLLFSFIWGVLRVVIEELANN